MTISNIKNIVFIKKSNIIEEKVDVIINADTSRFDNFYGIGSEISIAAGPELAQNCPGIIRLWLY